uniref:ANF_receptor domain-containing protein n=1 Tax=Angiostrongylus cantonensis TaxID=6313 RepID=A0A0K0CXY6_ANGCA
MSERFFVNYTECDVDKAVNVGIEFMKKKDIDVVIAPPCLEPAKMMAHLSTFYKKAILGWGFLTDSELSDTEIYPYVTKVTPDSFA